MKLLLNRGCPRWHVFLYLGLPDFRLPKPWSCPSLPVMAWLWLLTALVPVYAQPTIEWDKNLGGSSYDVLTALQQTRDGGYILGGTSISGVSGDKTQAHLGRGDFWVVKLDAAGNKVWDKTFGGNSNDALSDLEQTADGGYILGGMSSSGINGDKTQESKGDFDFWVVKLDAAGNKVWDKTFGGERQDGIAALHQTRDGGYILGGTSYSGISGDKTQSRRGQGDFWVVKIDAAGNKQWDKTIGGEEQDALVALLQTSDGGYILGGSSDSPLSGDKTQDAFGPAEDYWLVKLDAAGNKVWDKIFGGTDSDDLEDLHQTPDGGYILGGNSSSGISGNKGVGKDCPNVGIPNSFMWVLKLDAAGNKQWEQIYGDCNTDDADRSDYLVRIVPVREGGYLIGGGSHAGACFEEICRDNSILLLQLDAQGKQEWAKEINAQFTDFLRAVQQTKDGNIIVGGSSNSPASGDKTQDNVQVCQEDENGAVSCELDFWVVKLAPPPKGGLLRSFTLIDTGSEQPLQPLPEGDTLNLAILPTLKLNIRANTLPPAVGSVKFELSGQQTWTYVDNAGPYALFGDKKGDYNKWTPKPGKYTLRATPYAKKNARGATGKPLTIHFTVVDESLPPQVNPAIQWNKTLGGSNFDSNPYAIEQTKDGGYILGGNSSSGISGDKTQASRGNADYWVVKLDAAGNKVWDKTLGGSEDELFRDLQQTSDGGYIVGGTSASGISGDRTQASRGGFDYWIVKLDSAGNKVWDKTYGGWDQEWLFSLQQTSDGGYILGGSSFSGISGEKSQANRGEADHWVLKLDSAGNKVWDKTFGGSEQDDLLSVRQTPDGGYVLGGASLSGVSGDKTQASRGNRDYWVLKLDAQGRKQWDKAFGGWEEDYLQDLELSKDGGFMLGGWSNSGISGDKSQVSKGKRDYWVVKLDGAGKKQWDKTLGGSDEDLFSALLQTSDGGYALGGVSFSPASGDKTQGPRGEADYWLVQLDATGNRVWDKTLGGDQWDQLYALDQAHDGGIVLAGWTATGINGDKTEPGRGLWDLWVVKLAPFLQSQRLESFTLINTSSEQPIRQLHNGDTLHLADLPKKLSIRADTAPATVGSVTFKLSGQENRTYTDNAPPYALFGDVKGDYEKWYPAPGTYTLQATPYTQADGKGSAGASLTIHFRVMSGPAARLALDQEARQPEVLSQARLYPNPTSDGRIRVELAGQVQGPLRYTLVSSLGNTLAAGSLQLEEAGRLVAFDFSGQLPAAGVYYLRIEGSVGRQVFKILRR